MDPQTTRLLGPIAAGAFPVESIYTIALLRTAEPVGETDRRMGALRALSRRAAAGIATPPDGDGARAVLAGMTEERDGMFRRIVSRIETRAREQPFAGRA